RRQIRLAPLASTTPSVQRLFGFGKKKAKKGAPVLGSSGEVEQSNGLSGSDKDEQKEQQRQEKEQRDDINRKIDQYWSVIEKVGKYTSTDEAAGLAGLAKQGLQELLASLPGGSGKAAALMGAGYERERKRIRSLISECSIIEDRIDVELTKHQADQ